MRSLSRLGVTVGLALALSACTVSATPPTGGPAPTPSATGSDQAAPGEIVITARSIELLDESGDTFGSVVYTGDPDQAVALLTAFFGEPATEVAYAGAIEDLPGTDYVWGGFAYRVSDHVAEPEWYNQSVRVTSSAVDGIDIRTGSGIAIGSTRGEIEAQSGGPGESAGGETYFHGLEPYDRPDSSDPLFPGDLIDSILVVVDDGSDEVTFLLAPATNYGL